MFENIAWLTIKVVADGIQGFEADAFDLALLEQAQIGLGDPDMLCEILGLDAASRQHDGEIDTNGHGLDKLAVFFGEGCRMPHRPSQSRNNRGE